MTTFIIAAAMLYIGLCLCHMATETRMKRREQARRDYIITQQFRAPRPAPRPTVEDDWHRPDVEIGLDKRGRLLTREKEIKA